MPDLRQRNRNIVKLIILVVLVASIPLAVWWNSHRGVTVSPDIFKVGDLAHIDKVVLQSPADTVTLSYNGTAWQVNDRYKAGDDMINVLFATLDQAVSKQSIGSHAGDSIAAMLSGKGVLVKLWKGDQLVRQFYAGGSQREMQAYFMDPTDHVPYLVTIPGYRVYVSAIFEQPTVMWRSRRVFDMNWRNFQKMSAHFPDHPSDDFEIHMQSNEALVAGGENKTDTAKTNDYLDKVSLLYVDHYLVPSPDVSSAKALLKIAVFDVSNEEHDMTVWDLPGRLDRVVSFDEGAWGSLPSTAVEPLLKGKNSFY